jgi:hypothetical protein
VEYSVADPKREKLDYFGVDRIQVVLDKGSLGDNKFDSLLVQYLAQGLNAPVPTSPLVSKWPLSVCPSLYLLIFIDADLYCFMGLFLKT